MEMLANIVGNLAAEITASEGRASFIIILMVKFKKEFCSFQAKVIMATGSTGGIFGVRADYF